METLILKREYSGFEDLYDFDRDMSEALDSDFNPAAKIIPAEFNGTVTVTITYKEDED